MVVGLILLLYDPVWNRSMDDNAAYLDTLAVLPEYQNRGVGRSLVSLGMQMVNNYGIDAITLRVNSQDERVISFYEGCTFDVYREKWIFRRPLGVLDG